MKKKYLKPATLCVAIETNMIMAGSEKGQIKEGGAKKTFSFEIESDSEGIDE